jgi:SAM-dependent methyltransferase
MSVDPYVLRGRIRVPRCPVTHRDEEYDNRGFAMLVRMQARHFWYRGRHRFLLRAVHDRLAAAGSPPRPLRLVDLGGGCGGWLQYLEGRARFPIAERALADSSASALDLAGRCLPEDVGLYHVDLLRLGWRERWDVAFLLDVLEHIPDHEAALRQVHDALAPGGLVFITVPALNLFWTWNDEVVHHQRRYRRADFVRLAGACGFRLLDARYFMFFLSPLLLASRAVTGLTHRRLTDVDKRRLLEGMHRVPHPVVNGALAAIFGCESPLGHRLPFPWGTSLLAVLRRAS